MGRGGGGGGGGGGGLYLLLHCHQQNDFCIQTGSDESHFNVPLNWEEQSHKLLSTNHKL